MNSEALKTRKKEDRQKLEELKEMILYFIDAEDLSKFLRAKFNGNYNDLIKAKEKELSKCESIIDQTMKDFTDLKGFITGLPWDHAEVKIPDSNSKEPDIYNIVISAYKAGCLKYQLKLLDSIELLERTLREISRIEALDEQENEILIY